MFMLRIKIQLWYKDLFFSKTTMSVSNLQGMICQSDWLFFSLGFPPYSCVQVTQDFPCFLSPGLFHTHVECRATHFQKNMETLEEVQGRGREVMNGLEAGVYEEGCEIWSAKRKVWAVT